MRIRGNRNDIQSKTTTDPVWMVGYVWAFNSQESVKTQSLFQCAPIFRRRVQLRRGDERAGKRRSAAAWLNHGESNFRENSLCWGSLAELSPIIWSHPPKPLFDFGYPPARLLSPVLDLSKIDPVYVFHVFSSTIPTRSNETLVYPFDINIRMALLKYASR